MQFWFVKNIITNFGPLHLAVLTNDETRTYNEAVRKELGRRGLSFHGPQSWDVEPISEEEYDSIVH